MTERTLALSPLLAAYIVYALRRDAESWTHKRLTKEEVLRAADGLCELLPVDKRSALDRLRQPPPEALSAA